MDFLIYFTPVALLLLAKYYFPKRITFFEVGIGIVVISLSAYFVHDHEILSKIIDKEVLNGQVIEKVTRKVDCGHSYDCHCRRSSGSSSETCSTCYEHNYDVSWWLRSTIGNITIPRVNRQGTITPPAWEEAYESEPVSRINFYENYIKGAESSLFNDESFKIEERFKNLIPPYPITIYDHYRFEHASSVDVTVNDLDEWNHLLAESLKELGPTKKVNVVMLFVNTPDANYVRSLEKSWLKGNKNDVIIVAGSTNYPAIDWVEVISWSPSELLKVQIRDEIMSLGVLTPKKVVPIIEQQIKASYVPFDMSQFSHLKNEVKLSTTSLYWIFGILVIGSFIFSILAYKYKISRLFINLGCMGIMGSIMYLISMINFFYLFFGIPLCIGCWLIWLNFHSKRKRAKEAQKTNN